MIILKIIKVNMIIVRITKVLTDLEASRNRPNQQSSPIQSVSQIYLFTI